MTLLEQQCTQSMAWWLHPHPWFAVIELVVELDTSTQLGEGQIKVAPAVLELAGQHGFAHLEHVAAFVVEHLAIFGNAIKRLREQVLLICSPLDIARGGIRDTLGVVPQRGGDTEQFRVERHGFVNDLLPLAKADVDVHLHAVERFEIVDEELVLVLQDLGRHGLPDLVASLQRWFVLTQKHGRVHLEMDVVQHVDRVDPDLGIGCHVLLVGHDRFDIRIERVLELATQHIEVRRHVNQVRSIGHQRPQNVGLRQPSFGRGRHLHDVDLEVQQTRVRRAFFGSRTLERHIE